MRLPSPFRKGKQFPKKITRYLQKKQKEHLELEYLPLNIALS